MRKKICAVTLFLLFFSLYISVLSNRVFAVGDIQAHQLIDEARSALISSYLSVVDAEEAGANVTSLLVTLNNATDLLSKAEFAYANAGANGNYDVPYAYASECEEMLNGFSAEVLTLKNSAVQQGFSDFMIYFVGSILGTVGVVLGSYVLWVALKKKTGQTGSVRDEY